MSTEGSGRCVLIPSCGVSSAAIQAVGLSGAPANGKRVLRECAAQAGSAARSEALARGASGGYERCALRARCASGGDERCALRARGASGGDERCALRARGASGGDERRRAPVREAI